MNDHALQQPPELLKLLAHDLRWTLLQLLMTSDRRVQELATFTGEPMNLVSYHLSKLRNQLKVVRIRASEADRRDVYYSVNLDTLQALYQTAGSRLHPALAGKGDLPALPDTITPVRVLFVCTHNSGRSQMAEALLRHYSDGQVQVFSAGSHPTKLHPYAIHAMDRLGIDMRGQRSKSLQEFEGQSFDYIITVCDRAREICPDFPGSGDPLHWGFDDPTRIEDASLRQESFEQIAKRLEWRVRYFLVTLATSQKQP